MTHKTERMIKAVGCNEKERIWLEQNREAIEAHNKRIDREGTLLKPIWLKD